MDEEGDDVNSLERIRRVLSNEPVDRRPVSVLLGLYGARLNQCDLERYYSDPKTYYDGQVAVADLFDPDIIFTPVTAAKEAEAWGCDVKYFDNAPPIRMVKIKSIEEIDDIVFPDIWDSNYGSYFIKSTQLLSDQFKETKPIAGIWFDPMDMLVNVIGPDLYMELLLFNKEKFDCIIEKFIAFSVDYGNALLGAGADFLVNYLSAGNVAMITEKMARDIAYPILEKTYAQIKGKVVIHHGGYKIESFIDSYKNLTNLMGFVVDAKDNLVTSYEKIKATQVLIGNISGPTLDKYTPEQIGKICKKLLKDMKGKNRFILMTSGADVPYDATKEQIGALIESVSIELESNSKKKGDVIGIACGIFELEIKHLIAEKRIETSFVFLDSSLHMKPEELQKALDKAVSQCLLNYDKVLLVYGDCHPYMLDNYDPQRVHRLHGINCCSIILGNDNYRKLRKQGAFFVFNEWAHRWREIFVEDIGLNAKIAPMFMKSLHKSIVYLDVDSSPVPTKILEEMSAYFELPYEVIKVNLDVLCEAIRMNVSEVSR